VSDAAQELVDGVAFWPSKPSWPADFPNADYEKWASENPNGNFTTSWWGPFLRTLHAWRATRPYGSARLTPQFLEVGNPVKLRSAAGFARMSGVAPIPASSGKVTRHRFDRRGNRVLNRSIHMVAVVRCRIDPATKIYMAKKKSEGKSGKEAMRCLKRHTANDIYRRLKDDCQAASARSLTI
jgi:Transposase IS116/IS110/IS902 family